MLPRTISGATSTSDQSTGGHATARIAMSAIANSFKAKVQTGWSGPVAFDFESLEALGAAMGEPRTGEILADVANYTTIAPVMQTSEVVG